MEKGKPMLKILGILLTVCFLSSTVYILISIKRFNDKVFSDTSNTQTIKNSDASCSRIDLLELKILLPHISVRKADMPGYVLNNPCLPSEIKRTYEKGIALYSKKSSLEAQILKDYCSSNPKDCNGGNVVSSAGKEKYWALRDAAENADSDFKHDEDGFYLIENAYLKAVHDFIFSN